MMVATRQRRTREVTGPTPHSVAIFARPTNKIPPEHLILERRKQEEQRMEAEAMTKYNKLYDLKNDWERWTDRKIQLNTVKRRVEDHMKHEEFSLEIRRERLRQLLLSEEQEYLEQMAASEETVLERQAKMRDRARSLKEKREMERQKVVEEKLAQQWRDQCEELRGTLSKRQQDQVAAERMEQLRHKEEIAKVKEEEEKMYADLWYADMMAKAKREEEETKRQMSANKDTLEVLQRQVAALEAQKQIEKALIEEEAQILKEQAALRKMEEQQALEEKRRKQEEIREMYDKSLRIKKQKEARELQEQLAFDMKILEQLLEESRNEAMEQQQRKRELREEDRRYRAYLAQLKAEEEQRERELERLCDAEVEKMWEKKVKQWKLEKEARRKLLQDVMASRRVQLQEKLMENERRQREAAREREELLTKIEQNKRIEEENSARMHAMSQQHQNDLIGQMHYNRRMRDSQRDEEELMWRAQQDAEAEYRKKLEIELANPNIDKLHPIRKRTSALQITGSGMRAGGGLN